MGACLVVCRILIPCMTRDLIWATGVEVHSPNHCTAREFPHSTSSAFYSTNIYQASAQGI